MAKKSKILNCLTKLVLLRISNEFGYKGFSVLTKNEIIKNIEQESSIKNEDIIKKLKFDELKVVCRKLDIDESGRSKKLLINRINDHIGVINQSEDIKVNKIEKKIKNNVNDKREEFEKKLIKKIVDKIGIKSITEDIKINGVKKNKSISDKTKKIEEKVIDIEPKNYKIKRISYRISDSEIKTETYLRKNYTNSSGILICQICNNEMPFKTKDGQYYFEPVKISDNIKFEHHLLSLALCPLCAAKYKEFIKNDEDENKRLIKTLENNKFQKIPISFNKQKADITFIETHYLDIQTILRQISKNEIVIITKQITKKLPDVKKEKILCPICKAEVRRSKLDKHVRKAHKKEKKPPKVIYKNKLKGDEHKRNTLIKLLTNMGIKVSFEDSTLELERLYKKLKREIDTEKIKKELIKLNISFSDSYDYEKLKKLLDKEKDRRKLLDEIRRRKIQPVISFIKPVYDDDK